MSEDTDKGLPSWLNPPIKEGTVSTTARPFEFVELASRLPEGYFAPGMKVLSIGEGLSGFAKGLHDQFQVDVVAADPIYSLGDKVVGRSPDETKKAIKAEWGGLINFNPFESKELGSSMQNEVLPQIDKSKLVAASVYELPFRNEHFDKIISHRLVEHIDLAKALPELLRVLKPDGEIRMAGVQMFAIPEQFRLLKSGLRAVEGGGPWRSIVEEVIRGNIPQTFEWLVGNPGVKTYVVFDRLPRIHVSLLDNNMRGVCNAGIMVFRKDNITPAKPPSYDFRNLQEVDYALNSTRVSPEGFAKEPDWYTQELKNLPYLDQVMEVDPLPRRDEKVFPKDYYLLSPRF